ALTVREATLDAPHSGRLVLSWTQNPSGTARRIDLRLPAVASTPRFFSPDEPDAVQLEWTPSADADLLGYHVERARSPTGPFVRADLDLVRPAYFLDVGRAPSTRYYYRIVAVDSTLLGGPPGPVAAVSTNPPRALGWPLPLND